MSGAEHQPRTLRLASVDKYSPDRYEARISRDEEDALAVRVRNAEHVAGSLARTDVASQLVRLESELRGEFKRLTDDPRIRPRRQTCRDLKDAIALIGKVRRALAPAA